MTSVATLACTTLPRKCSSSMSATDSRIPGTPAQQGIKKLATVHPGIYTGCWRKLLLHLHDKSQNLVLQRWLHAVFKFSEGISTELNSWNTSCFHSWRSGKKTHNSNVKCRTVGWKDCMQSGPFVVSKAMRTNVSGLLLVGTTFAKANPWKTSRAIAAIPVNLEAVLA